MVFIIDITPSDFDCNVNTGNDATIMVRSAVIEKKLLFIPGNGLIHLRVYVKFSKLCARPLSKNSALKLLVPTGDSAN